MYSRELGAMGASGVRARPDIPVSRSRGRRVHNSHGTTPVDGMCDGRPWTATISKKQGNRPKKHGLNRVLLAMSLMLASVYPAIPRALAETQAGHRGLRFPIHAYRVIGNSLLKANEITRILEPYTGSQRSFADIEAAREALQKAYRRAGYSAVEVVLPGQELNGGIVTLRVVEARVVSVQVTGSPSYNRANVLHSLPALVVGQVPNMRKINEDLALANGNPGKFTSVLLRSGVQPNTIDASVDVKATKPWRTFLTLNNSSNAPAGNFLIGAGYQYANVANRDQVLTLQYITSPDHPDTVSAYGAGYHIPLYHLGDSLDLFAGYANINAGTVAQLFSVSGKGSVFGLHYNQHLNDTAGYKQKVIYGIDYRAYRDDASYAGTPIGADVTVHPLSLAYGGLYQGAQSRCGFTITGMQNIAGGSHGSSADFSQARLGATADYRLLRITTDCRRSIPARWQIRFQGSGQYTSQELVPSEQFGLGGLQSVRGFEERQFTGDKGIQGSFELYTPGFGRTLPIKRATLRALAFYDAGYVSLNDAQPGDIAHTAISSVGVGLHLNVAPHMDLELDYAHILRAGESGLADRNRIQGSLTLVD